MKVKENLWVALMIIVIAMVTRIMPHYPNFTALGAAALFGGARLSRKWAILIPVCALFFSDLFLNNAIYAQTLPGAHEGFIFFEPQSLWSYAAFLLIAWMGSALIRNNRILPVVGTSLLASLLFFAISNLGVWMQGAMYPKTFAGLSGAYAAGLPFIGNTIAGDFFFVSIFFGGFELARALSVRFARSGETP